METNVLKTSEVFHQIMMLFGEDYDFRYNTDERQLEFQQKGKVSWHTVNEGLVKSICGELTREYGDVYSPEFIRAILITETYHNAFLKSGLTSQEWEAENLLKWIKFRVGDWCDIRYNITTKEIQYIDESLDNWKVISQNDLIDISNEISSMEIKYSWQEVQKCFNNAPSLRFDEVRYAENILRKVEAILAHWIDIKFRNNVKCDYIEFQYNSNNSWKKLPESFLDVLGLVGDYHTGKEIKRYFKIAPSWKYEGPYNREEQNDTFSETKKNPDNVVTQILYILGNSGEIIYNKKDKTISFISIKNGSQEHLNYDLLIAICRSLIKEYHELYFPEQLIDCIKSSSLTTYREE